MTGFEVSALKILITALPPAGTRTSDFSFLLRTAPSDTDFSQTFPLAIRKSPSLPCFAGISSCCGVRGSQLVEKSGIIVSTSAAFRDFFNRLHSSTVRSVKYTYR